MPEPHKHQPIFSLGTNLSSDPVESRSSMPTIEEHDNLLNSEDEDEHTAIPVDDDGQIECEEASRSL